MSDQAWKLRDAPVAAIKPKAVIYQGANHDEALARLLFVIEQRRQCGLMFGPAGSGKSLLLAEMGRIVRRSAREFALIDLHGRNEHETLWELCGELGLNPKFNDGSFALWRRVQDHFVATTAGLLPAVVVLDHADQGQEETDTLVARLAHVAQQGRGLTLILAVRATSLADLPAALRDTTDLRIELGWLDESQTVEFVHTVFQYDDDGVPFFDDAAIRQMHALSHGSPRVLTHLGDLSVLSALASEETTVSEQTVLTAANDLQITGSPVRRTKVVSTSRPFYD